MSEYQELLFRREIESRVISKIRDVFGISLSRAILQYLGNPYLREDIYAEPIEVVAEADYIDGLVSTIY